MSERDYFRALDRFFAHRGIGDRGTAIAAPIAGVIAIWLITRGSWLGWLLLVMGVVLIAMMLLRRGLWRRHYRAQNKYRDEIVAEFGEDGIVMHSEPEAPVASWSTFDGFAEVEEFVILTIRRQPVSVIPMAAATDPAALVALVEDHLPRIGRRLL